ncbi:hypothetical protein HZF02_27540 [Pseudomonas yamanorum]|nr:hypothetical protein HZF02_27540 [Pseudomonas yamanorum]
MNDIDRALIDDFLGHLARLVITTFRQRSHYTGAKGVLYVLGCRGIFSSVTTGQCDFAAKPVSEQWQHKGETPLPKRQRQTFTSALRQAIAPIWHDDTVVTSELLAYTLLTVALHTGRNSTRLLEMEHDCLRAYQR